MITTKEYFMGRDVAYPRELTPELVINANELVRRVNFLLEKYADDTGNAAPGVRSGWRPAEVNEKVPGAAQHSKHMTCEACDLADNDKKLGSWCLRNLDFLDECGLWLESPESTPTWTHVQSKPPGSGHRVFLP